MPNALAAESIAKPCENRVKPDRLATLGIGNDSIALLLVNAAPNTRSGECHNLQPVIPAPVRSIGNGELADAPMSTNPAVVAGPFVTRIFSVAPRLHDPS